MPGSVLQGVIFAHMIAESEEVIDDCPLLTAPGHGQVPYETCKEVPDVECVTVLKDVPELECSPAPYTECTPIAIDIPFLEPAEECEEVVFEDCVEVG